MDSRREGLNRVDDDGGLLLRCVSCLFAITFNNYGKPHRHSRKLLLLR